MKATPETLSKLFCSEEFREAARKVYPDLDFDNPNFWITREGINTILRSMEKPELDPDD